MRQKYLYVVPKGRSVVVLHPSFTPLRIRPCGICCVLRPAPWSHTRGRPLRARGLPHTSTYAISSLAPSCEAGTAGGAGRHPCQRA